jgi:hypothetical protein
MTFRDLFYDFQASGDFQLARTGPDFVVQARQVSGAPAWPNAAVNQAIATRVGTSHVAVCTAPTRLVVNNKTINLANGRQLNLPDGGDVSLNGNVYLIRSANGNSVRAEVNPGNPGWTNVSVGLNRWPNDGESGLLANAGDNVNAVESRGDGGIVLTAPFDFGEFYRVYGDSWRLSADESLLSACGRRVVSGDPQTLFYANNLPPSLAKRARAICLGSGVRAAPLLDACTVDVAVLRNRAAAKVYLSVPANVTLGKITAPPATSPSWHIVKSVKTGVNGGFTAVAATGKATGWAFGGINRPAAWERNGSTWTKVAFPGKSGEQVVTAAATSPAEVWAFTDAGARSRVLRWNGHKWSVVKTFPEPIGGASAVSGHDVWVFGQPGILGQLGAWHYNGRTWSQVSKNLDGGSALAADNVWAFAGTNVDHWNGRAWASMPVKNLLPPQQFLNAPAVTGIYAQSAGSVYAIGNGNRQDEGGPTVVLHYNGHKWSKVAEGSFGYGTQPSQQISPDGHGGLWLPMPGAAGAPSYLVHYAAGKLTKATLPASAQSINVESAARIPGTTQALAGGFTHAQNNPGLNVVAVILQYS